MCLVEQRWQQSVLSYTVWTDWFVYILLKEITYQNRYLNKVIWLWNCSFINLLCSSLLTDEYQKHKTIRFIPMMKFCQSTQLILKLYGLKSQTRPCQLCNFWKVVSHAKGHQLKKWKTYFVHCLEIHLTSLFTVFTLAAVKEADVLR